MELKVHMNSNLEQLAIARGAEYLYLTETLSHLYIYIYIYIYESVPYEDLKDLKLN